MADWTAFTVFGGTCVLNKGIFSATTDFKFMEWVEKLREDALQGGIPEEQVEDVVKLLDKFFPAGAQPLLVAFKQPDPPNSGIVPDPETVSYGASKISINDGPSALGYIFSIAASNAPSPRTYSNYAVPLLAIYSRCLYLGYIFGEGGLPNEEGVPYMGNCMYTVLAGTSPAFDLLLGSTYQTIGDLRASKVQMMNQFRRGIVDGGLGQYKPAHTLPLEPRVHAGAILALKKYLRGLIPNKGGTNLWIPGTTTIAQTTPLIDKSTAQVRFEALSVQWALEWSNAGKGTIVALPFSKAVSSRALTKLGGPSIAQAIETTLGQIVDKRWEEGYNRTEAWTDLLPLVRDFYIQVYIPHMFPAQVPTPPKPGPTKPPSKPDPTNPPLKPDLTQSQVSMPDWEQPLEVEVDAILESKKDLVLDKLDHLYSWISTGVDNLSDGGPDRPRYGRCAETHPVVGLMQNYIPGRVIPPTANPSPVRGFAVQILRFNNTVLPNVVTCNNLSQNFNGTTLNAFHAAQANDPLYRLPCDNCKILLPALDAPIGQTAYYADMAELDPTDFPNIN